MKISSTKLGIVMAEKGVSFLELSKDSGVSRTTLSYIKNGKSCKPEIIAKIAKSLEVEMIELIEKE